MLSLFLDTNIYDEFQPSGHNKNNKPTNMKLIFILSLYSGYGITAGQNWKWDYGTKDWNIDEYKDFQWGVGSKNGKPVGHYTQVIYFLLYG